MMPLFDARAGLDRAPSSWEDILPSPFTIGIRVLSLQSIRQIDATEPLLQIPVMELFYLLYMALQRLLY